MLDQGKIRKYLLYAVGEIILIVIGIVLALQLNNLNESRKTRARANEALALVKTDLLKEIAAFERYTESKSTSDLPFLRSVYDKKWESIALDSLPLIGTGYFNFQPFNSAYQGLKSGGNLAIIDNDSLRSAIIYYFEHQHIHLADWSSWHKNFVTNHLEPYMFNELYINPDELVADMDHLKDKLGERRLNSLISTQIGSLTRIDREIKESRSLALDIVHMIDDEND